MTVGTLLGTYEIGALVGRGGMGEVYRARDSRLKRTVAIKILARELAQDPDRVQRFQQPPRRHSRPVGRRWCAVPQGPGQRSSPRSRRRQTASGFSFLAPATAAPPITTVLNWTALVAKAERQD